MLLRSQPDDPVHDINPKHILQADAVSLSQFTTQLTSYRRYSQAGTLLWYFPMTDK